MIPKQLQNPKFRFCLIRRQSKAPFEKEWQKKGYKYNDKKLLQHLKNGGNFGVIGGYGNLRILDIDDKTKIEQFKKEFENTFLVETGGGGLHLYFISEYNTNHVLKGGLGEFRANNYQVVGAGSLHPNGKKYKVLNNNPIVNLPQEMLVSLLKPYLKEELPTIEIKDKPTDKSRSGLEYRKVLALLREGKTKEQIFKQMLAYSKWKEAPKQYREMTYEKAKKFSEIKVDPETTKRGIKEIYKQIVNGLKYYIDMKEDYYSLVATWIIGTYFHNKFEAYPYLYFNAQKRSGKTRILKLIAHLSKGGKVLVSMSEAVLFRTAIGRTLCIDEFERIGSNEKRALRELLNAAYKKGLCVERMKKDRDGNYETEEFDAFFPIVMANIWGLDDVLDDRSIRLILERSGDTSKTDLIEDFKINPIVSLTPKNLSSVSDTCDGDTMIKIYKEWNNFVTKSPPFLPNSTNIVTNENSVISVISVNVMKKIKKIGLSGRDLELFLPLFVIANLCGFEVLDSLLKTAQQITEEKRERDVEESKDTQLIEFLLLNATTDFISPSALTNDFKKAIECEDKWLNPTWVGRALRRLVLLKDNRRIGKTRQVQIDLDKVKRKARMQGIEPLKESIEKQEELEEEEELPIEYKKIDSTPISDENKGSKERG